MRHLRRTNVNTSCSTIAITSIYYEQHINKQMKFVQFILTIQSQLPTQRRQLVTTTTTTKCSSNTISKVWLAIDVIIYSRGSSDVQDSGQSRATTSLSLSLSLSLSIDRQTSKQASERPTPGRPCFSRCALQQYISGWPQLSIDILSVITYYHLNNCCVVSCLLSLQLYSLSNVLFLITSFIMNE